MKQTGVARKIHSVVENTAVLKIRSAVLTAPVVLKKDIIAAVTALRVRKGTSAAEKTAVRMDTNVAVPNVAWLLPVVVETAAVTCKWLYKLTTTQNFIFYLGNKNFDFACFVVESRTGGSLDKDQCI